MILSVFHQEAFDAGGNDFPRLIDEKKRLLRGQRPSLEFLRVRFQRTDETVQEKSVDGFAIDTPLGVCGNAVQHIFTPQVARSVLEIVMELRGRQRGDGRELDRYDVDPADIQLPRKLRTDRAIIR